MAPTHRDRYRKNLPKTRGVCSIFVPQNLELCVLEVSAEARASTLLDVDKSSSDSAQASESEQNRSGETHGC